jgi:hypothetical protein
MRRGFVAQVVDPTKLQCVVAHTLYKLCATERLSVLFRDVPDLVLSPLMRTSVVRGSTFRGWWHARSQHPHARL